MAEENLKFIQMKNGEGVNVFPVTKVKAVEGLTGTLEDLQQQISNAVAGGVTDVKVNGVSVVENNVAYVPQILSSTEIQGMIDTTVGQQIHMNVEVVDALPESGVKGIIYLVAADKISGSYVEYIWTGSAFEQIGTTETDLTNYAKKSDLESAIAGLNIGDYAKAADVYTKDEVDDIVDGINGAIDLKANAADVYDKEAAEDMVDGKIDALSTVYAPIALVQTVADNKTAAEEAIALKANAADVYTKDEVDGLIDGVEAEVAKKANSTDVYTKGEIDSTVEGINGEIAKKANASDVEATVNGINGEIAKKADADDVYTKDEVFTKAELANVLYYEEVALD